MLPRVPWVQNMPLNAWACTLGLPPSVLSCVGTGPAYHQITQVCHAALLPDNRARMMTDVSAQQQLLFLIPARILHP
eukprot:3334086-Ditylum_brightwellii.AAC.1